MSDQIQLPDLETLFGLVSFCKCEECGSLYSPAAYLVDVLHAILETKISAVDQNGKRTWGTEILSKRRPDIENLELTCQNTNTPLPYVDLVNEILENAIAPVNAFPQTVGTADELAANPEHLNDNAYDPKNSKTPAGAVYPWDLPFNPYLETVRTYLERLSSSRYEVMQTFQANNVPPPSDLAAEYLMISKQEFAILTGIAPNALREFYGYSSDTVSRKDPKDPNNPIKKKWQDWLTQGQEFLDRTGLAFEELIELLKTHFLNPNQTLTVDVAGSDPCDVSKMNIPTLDEGTLKKLHRFVRLWKKLGWQIGELDKVLTALGATDIDDVLLQKLAHIHRLQSSLNLPLDHLIAFWARIDIEGRDSLYMSLFQNKLVLNPVDPAFTLAYSAHLDQLPIAIPDPLKAKVLYDNGRKQLSFIGTMTADEKATLLSLSVDKSYQLAVDDLFEMRWLKDVKLAIADSNPGDATISTHTPAILAAVRVSATDFSAIRTATGLADPDPNNLASLNLENLSILYRHAVLAKALNLPVNDFLTLKTLTGIDPFQAGEPASTAAFLTTLQKVRQSGFSVGQLNYLYRHVYDPTRGVAPLQANLDLVVSGLQAGLKKIADDTTVVPDPTGDLLRKKLAVVLETSLIDPAMSLIDGTAVYSASLDSLPNVTFPDGLKNKIAYDSASKQLRFTGAMTDDEEGQLLKLSLDAKYEVAIKDIYQQPRDLIAKKLEVFLDPTDAIDKLINKPLPTQPERFNYALTRLMAYLGDSLSHSLIKQTVSDSLKLDTAVTNLLLGTILKSQTDAKQTAMTDLLALRDGGLAATYFSDLNLKVATATQVVPTIDLDPQPAAPFSSRWTGKVQAQHSETYTFYVRANDGARLWVDGGLLIDKWQNQVLTEYSATLALKTGQLYDFKMEYYSTAPGAVRLSWSSPSTDKATIPQGVLYPASGFRTLSLLHKIALLVNSFKMTAKEVAYLSSHSANFADFDLNSLPLDRSDPAKTDASAVKLFNQWQHLRDLFALRDALPQGDVDLIDVFAAASIDEAKTKLALATGWDSIALDALTGKDGLGLAANDFKKETQLVRLQPCWALINRLGVSAKQLFNWAKTDPDPNQSQEIKNAVKAKYDDQTWLTVAKPFQDVLREKRRAALVSFLVGNPNVVDGQTFRNNHDLFDYFLIDVEMSPCQMTSRIKQAISSVQIFVQRCLMKLEWYPFKDANGVNLTVDPEVVQWWKWMKNYRVWEANRKIFLYPWNWIDTALLPDKTPFFKDLENKLLQADITADTAEDAFRDYLEKLDQVARLEVVGLFHEPPTEDIDPDLLHVFGRTAGVAPVYFYRKRVTIAGSVNWTPWEKVDVDIQGDHLIPVVWNRRLHIFWPVFTTKSPDQKGGDPPPPKHLEIQIAWSEYKNNKWSPKNLSSGHLISNPGDLREDQVLDKGQYLFKAAVEKDTGDLIVRSLYRDAEPRGVIYYAIDDNDKFTAIPNFTGNVRGVHVAAFRFVGCEGEPLLQRIRLANHKNLDPFQEVFTAVRAANQSENDLEFLPDPLLLPTGTNTENMMVVESKATRLSIPAGTSMDDQQEETVLGTSPSPFRLLYPQDEIDQFYSQDPFFYQDDKTFFVEPEKEPVKDKWHDGNKASPDWLLQQIVH